YKKQGRSENLRVLLVRAEKARDTLPKELSALGAIVDEAFAYRTVPETRDTSGARRQLAQDGADLITFTSSSTVENFLALGLPWPRECESQALGRSRQKLCAIRGSKSMSRRAGTISMAWCRRSGNFLQRRTLRKVKL